MLFVNFPWFHGYFFGVIVSCQKHKAEANNGIYYLRIKSLLRVGQEHKKFHVTDINEAIFLWPDWEQCLSSFSSTWTRVRTIGCLCSKGQCLDNSSQCEIKCNGSVLIPSPMEFIDFRKRCKVRAEERTIILSLISLLFLLVTVFVQEGIIRNDQVLSVSCSP